MTCFTLEAATLHVLHGEFKIGPSVRIFLCKTKCKILRKRKAS